MIDFATLKATARLRAEELLREWFPNGKVRGAEFIVGNLEGEPGESLSINLNKGIGKDFSTGQTFGDLIDVYAAKFGVEIATAATQLGERLGVTVKLPASKTHGVVTRTPKPAEPANWEEACYRDGVTLPDTTADLTPAEFVIDKRGTPDHVHIYRTTEGRPIFVVTRWDGDEAEGTRKFFCPWTLRGDTWTRKAPPSPRPLYGMETLTSKRNVLIVEGEKAADAARRLFPDNPVVTWPNGASAVRSADWSVLKGRKVLVWPDNDAPGREALAALADVLMPIIDGDLRWIDAGNLPQGYDAADWDGPPGQALAWIKARTRTWTPAPPVEEYVKPPEPPAPAEETIQAMQVVWTDLGLETRANGLPYASSDNAVRVLQRIIPEGHLHYDTFLNEVRFSHHGTFHKLADHHLITLTITLQREYKMQDIKKHVVADAVHFHAQANRRNCLTEWLESLTWDNVNRVQELFIRGFGSEDNDYTRAAGTNFLIGMVARAMRPGCQLDTLPILEGQQGIGKSRGLAALAGQFYADVDAPMGTREFAESIQGKWLVELSELSAMRPSDVEKVKSGITRVVDVYREPFAVLASDHPRQCVFAGTTNQTNYLLDSTGNRRFWPIRCGTINRTWIAENRAQLFAEALHLYLTGCTWWQMPGDMVAREQNDRVVHDVLADKVAGYCDHHTGQVRVSEILESLEIPKAQWNSPLQKRVAESLRNMGYIPVKSNGYQVWRKPGHVNARVRAV